MDLSTDRRKDQHFLTDRRVLERIVAAAGLRPDEAVLEIGAGPGNLTRLLAAGARQVYAIELDARFAGQLAEEFRGSNVQVLAGDALTLELPPFDKAVANLPYSISSPVTFRLLRCRFKLAVLMYQKEFALRMAARVGAEDYSRLSVAVQHFAGVEILFTVPPGAFAPPPEVESAVVRLTPRPPRYRVADEDFFLKLVAAAFAGRRKRLRNALVAHAPMIGLREPKRAVDGLPREITDRRAEQVSPEEYALLANELWRWQHGQKDLPGPGV